MMNTKLIAAVLVLALAGLLPAATRAQTSSTSCTSSNVTENFTGAATNCSWYFIGGACLTAGSSSSTTSPGVPPACHGDAYYSGVTLAGGNTGTLPDTIAAGGALRLTNNSGNESGAIISNGTYALAANGLQVTFTTETYAGDSGSNSYGGDSDGADGISFFLQDVSVDSTPTLGDFGGSLGYTCSNTNNSATQGYDGMIGAYLGLGIDDFGNFLDGSWVTSTSGGATVFNPSVQGANPQDNTATGYGKTANRVGMRGAGNVAWSWLTAHYGTNNIYGNPVYYPNTLNGSSTSTPYAVTAQALQAVKQTCETGYLWNFSGVTSSTGAGSATYTPANPGSGSQSITNPYNATITTTPVNDYAVLANAYSILAHPIANESALYRGYATTATTGTHYGIPITYNLTISPAGLLSLSYSYNGGNFQPVISGQSIATNGTIPAAVRFGFAGSTGGSTNIHEIMCFQAQPQNSASSSAGLNQKQTAKVQTGTQVYFAFYNSSNWTGSLTSQYLVSPVGFPNDLEISSSVNWDASCVLTGTAGGATCPTTQEPNVAAENPDTGRVIWSYAPPTATESGPSTTGPSGAGIPFTWTSAGATSLTTAEQTNLNFGVIPAPPSGTELANSLLEYLRGVRSDEQTATGVGPYTPTVNPSGFRARTSVLGDIVDSSPTWVGPPSASFPTTWTDALYPTATQPENAGPTYANFETNYSGRMNVVYAGANDGFLHGFRSGYFTNGVYAGTTTAGVFTGTDNDGLEVLAYMPSYVVNTINSSQVAGTTTPNSVLDYSSPLYAHKFSVDGTPGTGDLYYNGGWHTWLVGGLGAGGSSIYALEITNPTTFTQGNAAGATAGSGVIGEWSTSITSTTTTTGGVTTTAVSGYVTTLKCATSSYSSTRSANCGGSLGKTYGTPQIRRFHNSTAGGATPSTSWGAVFGNGGGSFNGDAGIYVMLANNTGPPTIYYLSTGVGTNYSISTTTGAVTQSGTANGIYFVAPADLDGDHVTDYVYAGDLQGNVWRFDLTSSNPANWAVTAANGIATTTMPGTAIYSTGSTSIPITTQILVASVTGAGSANPRVLVEFGTGQQNQFTNNSSATYATSQQYLIGVWDWNFSGNSTSSTPVTGAWNTISNTKYASLPSGGTSAPGSISGFVNLEEQTISATTYNSSFAQSSASCTSGSSCATNDYYRTISSNTVCWTGGTAACLTGQTRTQYGWYLPLTSGYPDSADPSGLLSSTSTNAAEIYEQVIFNPTLADGTFLVNTTIPPTTSLAQCSSTPAGGWTMAINPATGGAFTNSFFGAQGTPANHTFLNVDNGTLAISGIALSGTGSPAVVVGGTSTYLVTQTVSGSGTIVQMNPPGATQGSRLTWIQKR